ncbi:TPR-like protein [Rhizoctonia solani]|uniref:TPR-like protein n=1 Tax=Rhizoctonia solani TaxID=456999 RepID=A0A8H7M219_9AGAM|nr:TPR-like protein [Rhizoctonia solani]
MRLITLAGLAHAHVDRFELLSELEDLDKAIEYMTIGLIFAPGAISEFPMLLSELAIEYSVLALSITTNNQQILLQLSNIASFHNERFERIGDLKDVRKAMAYMSRAVAITPPGDPQLLFQFDTIGQARYHLFKRLGDLDDLNEAIEYESYAVQLTPDNDPYLVGRLAHMEIRAPAFIKPTFNLGESYRNRFKLTGELNDIEMSIEYDSRAVALDPEGHPFLSNRLSTLGASYLERFGRLGDLEDIEKAIYHGFRALNLAQDGNPFLPEILANLAMFYSTRYDYLGERDDLKKSIEHQSRAVELTPDDHPHLADQLALLGLSYKYQFEWTEKFDDIDKAIEYNLRAVSLTPEDHPNLLAWLGHPEISLWLANLDRPTQFGFEHLGEHGDIERAVEFESLSLTLTPDGHPALPRRHFGYANSCLFLFFNTNNASHLQNSLDSFRMAASSLSGAPRERFDYAFQWAKHASTFGLFNSVEAYQAAVDLLPQFIWLGATVNQRYEDLSKTEGLGVEAASAAIRSSDYALALEWLEHTRCVVWNQILMLRSPLDKLSSVDPDLATRLQSIANKLRSASSESREFQAHSIGPTIPEQVAQEHRRMAKEYNDLLSRVRKLPGLHDFLGPMKAEDLFRAARYGPVVVINCHADRCDALARRARSEIEKSLRSRMPRERGFKRRPEPEQKDNFGNILSALWNDVIRPVIDHLGYIEDLPGNYGYSNSEEGPEGKGTHKTLPHVTWCPTGAMTFLPLHAAGDYNQPRSKVFDYVVSSYTPTLTALLRPDPSTSGSVCRIIAIGQEATPGQSRLPGTIKELAYVKAHTQDKVEYSQLVDDQATKVSVLDAMEEHDWVHFACHAHQNVRDPTKSGFFLYDGTLDLAAINRRSFKDKGFAFLSACQTATGDEVLPDEAIHLASGMLMAGYPSVIATMWSVMDDDAPFVADKVYGKLMKGRKLRNGEAGKALHYAIGELREKVGEKEFGRWVPYIHIGS